MFRVTLLLILLFAFPAQADLAHAKWATGTVLTWNNEELKLKVSSKSTLVFVVDPVSEIHTKPRVGYRVEVHYYLEKEDHRLHIIEVR